MQKVKDLCEERKGCRVKASSDSTFFPDPCPDTGKYLKIVYKCVPVQMGIRTGQGDWCISEEGKKTGDHISAEDTATILTKLSLSSSNHLVK
ncbi:hypothetical protein EB796_001943 [Bugula neritina]|uniref:SUEL-type lectin domain-containing protein n=1 Tax=Bugula neritina TaxID=10212 RepID=A0A7J7KNP4_BUGNE|nr:hypothetical protein EB796_001943 [Bugula neritina]